MRPNGEAPPAQRPVIVRRMVSRRLPRPNRCSLKTEAFRRPPPPMHSAGALQVDDARLAKEVSHQAPHSSDAMTTGSLHQRHTSMIAYGP